MSIMVELVANTSAISEPVSIASRYAKRGSRRPDSLIDFENYLIAASPPGFEVLRLQSSFSDQFSDRLSKASGDAGHSAKKPELETAENGKCSFYADSRLKVAKDSTAEAERILSWELSYKCESENGKVCHCSESKCKHDDDACADTLHRKPRRNVHFADDEGLDLEEVRVMTEPSNVPPVLSHIHARLDDEDDDEHLEIATESADKVVAPTPPPSLIINFQQPAADYVAFREQLEKSCVCLENVIVRNRHLFGTIRVCTWPCDGKSVVIRTTFDAWKSFCDVRAVCIFTTGSSTYSENQYETFSFDITVPVDCEERVEFAVCYKCDSREYWDNNSGRNYEVINRAITSLTFTVETQCGDGVDSCGLGRINNCDAIDSPFY